MPDPVLACMKHTRLFLRRWVLAALSAAVTSLVLSADSLEAGFRNPPSSARPWVYWFPLDGNLSRQGITLDLEAMQRVGIGGVLYMETDQGAPRGPAAFAGPLWRDLFKHICAEADRLGLQVNMNNDAGWCGSGGPWITPELSMQKVVWAETTVDGPQRFDAVLPQPQATRDFYRDIAVFAFPTPAVRSLIPRLRGKSAETREEIPLRAAHPPSPPAATVARDRILDLTPHLDAGGRLTWDVPAGPWTVLRLGHTSTGKDNHPAPIDGRGLECDKLRKEAAEAMFAGLMGKLIADNKARVGSKGTLVSTHIDSWEVGSQNWTPRFRQEFQRLRGYDPLLLLPVMTGRIVESREVSERFLWDVRMTVHDLLMANYAGHFRELAHQAGLRLSIEAYDGPSDDMTYAGRADEPMGEFWSYAPYSGSSWCTEMASAAHVYGKRILGAEAFTATDDEKWQAHPGSIKAMGDWAFCEGINRFVFHRYALQPWAEVRPGMSMGPWGLHYERTQTWWEQSRAWHEYLARCQFLLQQGLFVADLCFLAPETSPQRFCSPVKSGLDRPGYNFDGCPPEVVLTRMKVKRGRLVLPDGMSYRLLVLPQVETMTPSLLRRIERLVREGATVVGAPPLKSPSLSGYPGCDAEVQALVSELWGTDPPPAELTERRHGRGRIVWGGAFRPKTVVGPELENPLGSAQWIWRREGNPAAAVPPGRRYFRRTVVVGRESTVDSATLTLTADNAFECWVNGRQAGSGDNFGRLYPIDLTRFLVPGTNVIAVAALNGADYPNPAGLIGMLRIKDRGGHIAEVPTDRQWEAAQTVPDDWTRTSSPGTNWTAAMELGALGMAPWGDIQSASPVDPIADVDLLCQYLQRTGLPPDFKCEPGTPSSPFRYIHRAADGADVYFVANKNLQPETALCTFRVAGRRPEFWWPDSGRVDPVAVYDADAVVTRVPVRLDAHGSVFVVFRKGALAKRDRVVAVTWQGKTIVETQPDSAAPERNIPIGVTQTAKGELEALVSQPGAYALQFADGRSRPFTVTALPAPLEIGGPWDLHFAPDSGGPDRVTLDHLASWSEHPDPRVKYFSGRATYVKTLSLSPDFVAAGRRLFLDLGQVAVMAEVRLNGRDLGILWKSPFRLDITEVVRPGENRLEVAVVNLWINRQIGDEQLPEDSDRNPNGTLKSWPSWLQEGKPSPTGRRTFTSWRLWKKDDPLAVSGLLGPVTLQVAAVVAVK